MKNKGERSFIEKLKFLRRIRVLNLDISYYCYKAQGKPCSCNICKKPRFCRKIKHKNEGQN